MFDTLDGAIGVVEMELEKKGVVEIDLVFALVVYCYECKKFVLRNVRTNLRCYLWCMITRCMSLCSCQVVDQRSWSHACSN